MPTKRPRITVTLDDITYEQLLNIASQQDKDISKVTRSLLEKSLNIELAEKNLDFIIQIMRTQIQDILQLPMDRIISLQSKTCIQAGAAAYLSAEAIRKFVPIEEQLEVKEAYDSARRKAIEYTRRRVNFDEEV